VFVTTVNCGATGNEMRFFFPIKFLVARSYAFLAVERCLQADFNDSLPGAFNADFRGAKFCNNLG